MGTVFEISVVARDQAAARSQIEAAFDRAAQLERLLSSYDPQSQVNLLARRAGSRVPVDARLADLLQLAVEYAELTGGSFDVTLGPLVTLWNEASRRDRLPTEAELAGALRLVDAGRIRVYPDGSAELPLEGMSLELGGIAKGYALDLLAPELWQAGYTDALLSFGQSSVWALGAPPGHKGWRLLLRDGRGGFSGVLTLKDRAFSVSSSLGQWTEIAGQRYGHVIDPRDGFALSESRQAAVVAPSATLAEALSTALLILDVAEGLALVEDLAGSEALLIDERGRRAQTSGWLRATHFERLEKLEEFEELEEVEPAQPLEDHLGRVFEPPFDDAK